MADDVRGRRRLVLVLVFHVWFCLVPERFRSFNIAFYSSSTAPVIPSKKSHFPSSAPFRNVLSSE
jgi:hypothetical protein